MKVYKTHFFIYLVISLMAFSGLAAGQEAAADGPRDFFVKGNLSYKDGQYAQAIEHYDKIIQKGKVSGPLFYNIGNAYFKMGKIGKAILNYERAARFIPRDHDLRANHQFALSLTRTVNKEKGRSFFAVIKKGVVGHFTMNEIFIALYLMLLTAGLAHLCALYFCWPKKLFRNCLVVLGLFFLLFMYEMIGRVKALDHLSIVTVNAHARFEPREEATTHFALNEGEKVKVLREVEGWSKIQRADEKAGWIKSGKIERIMQF